MYSTGTEGGSVVTQAAEKSLVPRMAIVADLDRVRLSATADVMAAAGFDVARASSQESLAGLLEQHNPSIVVADHAFAGLPVTAPLLLLIDLEDESEAESVAAEDPGDGGLYCKARHAQPSLSTGPMS